MRNTFETSFIFRTFLFLAAKPVQSILGMMQQSDGRGPNPLCCSATARDADGAHSTCAIPQYLSVRKDESEAERVDKVVKDSITNFDSDVYTRGSTQWR